MKGDSLSGAELGICSGRVREMLPYLAYLSEDQQYMVLRALAAFCGFKEIKVSDHDDNPGGGGATSRT